MYHYEYKCCECDVFTYLPMFLFFESTIKWRPKVTRLLEVTSCVCCANLRTFDTIHGVSKWSLVLSWSSFEFVDGMHKSFRIDQIKRIVLEKTCNELIELEQISFVDYFSETKSDLGTSINQ